LLYAAQIEALNEREQEIFSLHFGLNKEKKAHPLQEVGNTKGFPDFNEQSRAQHLFVPNDAGVML